MDAALRTQPLRIHAVLLSEAADLLTEPAAAPPAAPQVPRPRRSRRSVQAAADALTEAHRLLRLTYAVLNGYGTAAYGCILLEHENAAKDRFARTLVSEILESGILEQFSRLVLLLSGCEGWQDEAAMQLGKLAEALIDPEDIYAFGADVTSKLLLSSPCLSYLLSSHVVGLCAALDGGPTYGMPAAAGAAAAPTAAASTTGSDQWQGFVAPVYGLKGLRLQQPSVPEDVGTWLAQWALSVWQRTIDDERLKALGEAPSGKGPQAASKVQAPPAEQHKATQQPAVAEAAASAVGPPAADASAPAAHPPVVDAADSVAAFPASDPVAPAVASLPAATLRAAYRRQIAAAEQGPQGPETAQQLTTLKAKCALTAMPPLHTGGTFELCMRLAAAASEAMLAADRPAAAGVMENSPPPARPCGAKRIAACEVADMAFWALRTSRHAIGARAMAARTVNAATADRIRRWWRAAVTVIDAAEGRGETCAGPPRADARFRSAWNRMKEDLSITGNPSRDMPPEPSPCVGAALDAGFLPRLLTLLRAVEHTGEGLVRLGVLPADGKTRWAWKEVLAFGDPRETSALLDHLTGMLRSVVPPHGRPASAGVQTGQEAGKEPSKPSDALAGSVAWAMDLFGVEAPGQSSESAAAGASGSCSLQGPDGRGVTGGLRAEGCDEGPSVAPPAAGEASGTGDAPQGTAPTSGPPPAGSSPRDAFAPGLPRLELLLSYAMVHVLPAAVEVLLMRVVPAGATPAIPASSIRAALMVFLTWVSLVAGAMKLAKPKPPQPSENPQPVASQEQRPPVPPLQASEPQTQEPTQPPSGPHSTEAPAEQPGVQLHTGSQAEAPSEPQPKAQARPERPPPLSEPPQLQLGQSQGPASAEVAAMAAHGRVEAPAALGSSPHGSSGGEAQSDPAAREWRHLLMAMNLPALLGTSIGIIKAGPPEPRKDRLTYIRYILGSLLHFAPLEVAEALATETAAAAEAAAVAAMKGGEEKAELAKAPVAEADAEGDADAELAQCVECMEELAQMAGGWRAASEPADPALREREAAELVSQRVPWSPKRCWAPEAAAGLVLPSRVAQAMR
ncbi:hypothetical protein GPECTOR_50g595 [Gonium pectorale]|uniref:Uncharacterized protein n=1 Tax=Gonium pectorale TaxID=33097 RepID=A0A150G7K3_GONPE|nr:hypothetical protein GPECTOR_50g595 [Gonium pectorale]|eukprot:KXZ45801.1 hypothetical protein GPECTOR_50g595 [Gonium pectorale]